MRRPLDFLVQVDNPEGELKDYEVPTRVKGLNEPMTKKELVNSIRQSIKEKTKIRKKLGIKDELEEEKDNFIKSL